MNYYRKFGFRSYNPNNKRDMIADVNDFKKYCEDNNDILQINNTINRNNSNKNNTPMQSKNSFKINNGNTLTGGSNTISTISRKHAGIHQNGKNKGRLKKGYMYTGKFDKNGDPNIIKLDK